MRLEPELAQVFLEEARLHLGVLRDEARGAADRIKAAGELRGAAGLVGIDEVRDAANDAERWLRAGDATRARQAIEQASAILAELALEEAPALSSFDSEETRLIQQMFREEANDHLEGITASLLALEKDRKKRAIVDELLRKTHTLKGSAATVGMTFVSEAAHALEETFIQLRDGRLDEILSGDALFDGLMAATDTVRAVVDSSAEAEIAGALVERLRALLALLTSSTAGTSPGTQEPTGPREGSGPIVIRNADASTPGAEDWEDRRTSGADRRAPEMHSLRVDAARLDAAMDAASELVFDRTRIERRVQDLRGVVREMTKTRAWLRATLGPLKAAVAELPATSPLAVVAERAAHLEAELGAHVAHLSRTAGSLIDDTEALRRTTSTLQDGLTRMRLVSVRALFQRLARPLRDIARREGKKVELVATGEETELDRSVVEHITDPLIHMVRNAVAHGIEPSGERVARRKNAVGRVTLAARHQGDSVFIEIGDDGRGIDPARIRASLVSSGRMSKAAADALDDTRAVATIFDAGFSTRDEADELAGRGVGLDVVRDTVARLGGEITVASTAGEGTRFTLRLPLTMAVAQAFLFKVGGQVYAIPNVHVVETTWIEASSPALPSHLRVREDPVPLVALHKVLGLEPPADARRLPAVVLEFAGRRLATTCDKIVGAREIVVKSLGPLLAPLGLYAGATISGSGKVQLILDPATLAQIAYATLAPASPVPELVAPVVSGPIPRAVGADATSEMPAITARPARILVADDSRAVREAVARMLAAFGHIVDAAVDGAEAWEMLQEVRYDLVVTDVEMPRMTGLELVARMRAAAKLAALPVLVISSRHGTPHRDKAVQAGASAFLPKPVTRQSIGQEIDRLLARKK